MDIRVFEQHSYDSYGCNDSDPDECESHTHVAELSVRARELFADALVAVTTADGIELSLGDSTVAIRRSFIRF